jgi:hypothetical protein
MQTHSYLTTTIAFFWAFGATGLAWFFYLTSRARMSPETSSVPSLSPELMEDVRVAGRVAMRAFLNAGGARRYVAQMDSRDSRAEILARAWSESYLSALLSGEHTQAHNMVIHQIGQAWGTRAAFDAVTDLAGLYESDAMNYSRYRDHPVLTWAKAFIGENPSMARSVVQKELC